MKCIMKLPRDTLILLPKFLRILPPNFLSPESSDKKLGLGQTSPFFYLPSILLYNTC